VYRFKKGANRLATAEIKALENELAALKKMVEEQGIKGKS
jgi:hypothetical protein